MIRIKSRINRQILGGDLKHLIYIKNKTIGKEKLTEEVINSLLSEDEKELLSSILNGVGIEGLSTEEVYIGTDEPTDKNIKVWINPEGKTTLNDITEKDKADIIQGVLEGMGVPVYGFVDENNDIIVSGNLAGGSYNVKYEMEDGSTIDIGDLVLVDSVYYSITNTLTNCTTDNSTDEIAEGESYSATITANSGYELSSVSVTMGGTDISSSVVSGGVISIASVTGDIVITAVATEITSTSTYTNLADPSSADWATDMRLNSSGVTVAQTGVTTTNYIYAEQGSIIRIKGFGALTDYNTAQYQLTKVVSNVGKANTLGSYATYSYDSVSGIVTLTNTHAQVYYFRFSGILTGTADDVIITVDEEIVEEDTPRTNFFDASNGFVGRLSSTGEDRTDATFAFVTNYISVQQNDIVEISGCDICKPINASATTNCYMTGYDSSKSNVYTDANYVTNTYWSVDSLTDTYALLTVLSDSIAYFRFTCMNPDSYDYAVDTSNIVINIKRNGEWL